MWRAQAQCHSRNDLDAALARRSMAPRAPVDVMDGRHIKRSAFTNELQSELDT